jgi:hypothetical protein
MPDSLQPGLSFLQRGYLSATAQQSPFHVGLPDNSLCPFTHPIPRKPPIDNDFAPSYDLARPDFIPFLHPNLAGKCIGRGPAAEGDQIL